MSPPLTVICDFDGTITTRDIGYSLCDRFAPNAIERADVLWQSGEISFREAFRRSCREIRGEAVEIVAHALDVARTRPGFRDLVELCAETGVEFVVASAGTFDDEHHRLALVNLPDLKEQSPEHAGVNHVAYTLADLGSLLATYLRLKANDIVPWWCINHGPTTSMYFRDPDGNAIELQVDNFDDERLTGWMRSDKFQQNPLGVEFDPDLLAEKYCAGEALEVLLEQGSAPKS